MHFAGVSVSVLAIVCGGCLASVGPGKPVPIEDVYPSFSGRSGIMVYQENFKPVTGYAIYPFGRPNTNRNHFKRRRNHNKVKFLVLHMTESFSSESTVKQFTENTTRRQTSAHYVIVKPNEAGEHKQLLRMVRENYIAYHAGRSKWGKYLNCINSISIGIEIVNGGYYKNSWDPFHNEQIRIAGLMLARMVDQYNVSPHYVVGHADIAPYRKYDPGVMFPWGKLYTDYGVGAWLDDDELDEKVIVARYKPKTRCPRKPSRQLFLKYLRAYGYDTRDKASAIKAFKAHYTSNLNPSSYNEELTHNEMYWIWALVAKYM